MSKRRKYDVKNKRSFIIIVILSVAVIGIFSLFIYKYVKTSKIEYIVKAETVLQDVDRNYLTLDDDGTLRVRWDNTYFLDYKEERITLGKKIIAYNSVANEIKLYGTFYEIQSDGKIVENKNESVLSNVNDAKFYKIDDREYLLVDSKITSEDNAIEGYNYMLVELDKAGNAKLSNNKLNLKTISPTVLVTSKYRFDIANEKLYYGELEIDLKKIIGSTNQYVPEDDSGKGKEDNDDGGSDNNVGNQIVGGGSGNVVTPDDIINNTKPGEVVDMDEVMDKIKMTSILRIVEGVTTVDVDYIIYDPYNEYSNVKFEIIPFDINDTTVYEPQDVVKNDIHATLKGLKPNKSYRIKLRCDITKMNEETGISEIIPTELESFDVRTKMPKYGISIYRISQYNNNLTFKIDLDKELVIDKMNVRIEFIGDDIEIAPVYEPDIPVTLDDKKKEYKNVKKELPDNSFKADIIKLVIESVVDESGNVLEINESYSVRLYEEVE